MSGPRTLSDARLKLLAEHLHSLGVQPLFYFLREVRDGYDIERHLERYGDIDATIVKTLGVDKFFDPIIRQRAPGRRGRVQ